jgi:hypothetical protein
MTRYAPVPEQRTATVADIAAFSENARINALCNRLARHAGWRAADEIATLATLAVTPRGWAEGLRGLAAAARAENRAYTATCYERAAEAIMEPMPPQRPAAFSA